MDLSKPSYVHIEKLDRQLEALEHDLRQMENENGITEEYIENYQRQKDHLANRSRITDKSNKSILKSGQKSKSINTVAAKDGRYKNLPSVKVDDTVPKPIIKTNPEIDPEWQKANKTKPNLMTFFNKEEFQPTKYSFKDFEAKPAFVSDYSYFYDYMSNFANSYTKNIKVQRVQYK